jgi:hypothetical protein
MNMMKLPISRNQLPVSTPTVKTEAKHHYIVTLADAPTIIDNGAVL